jgi:hypothetical protein
MRSILPVLNLQVIAANPSPHGISSISYPSIERLHIYPSFFISSITIVFQRFQGCFMFLIIATVVPGFFLMLASEMLFTVALADVMETADVILQFNSELIALHGLLKLRGCRRIGHIVEWHSNCRQS